MERTREKRPNTRRKQSLRKLRRDAGSIRPTSRDSDVIRLGIEQTFIRYDTIGEWLAPDHSIATATPPLAQLQDITPPAKRTWPQDYRHRLMAVHAL